MPFHRNKFAEALYLLGNIQPEKSKKRLSPLEGSRPGREIAFTAPYLSKEHPRWKKGEKILVPVRFSRSRPGERGHRWKRETRASRPHTGSVTGQSMQTLSLKLLREPGSVTSESGSNCPVTAALIRPYTVRVVVSPDTLECSISSKDCWVMAAYFDQFRILVKEYGTSLLTSYSVIFPASTSKNVQKDRVVRYRMSR